MLSFALNPRTTRPVQIQLYKTQKHIDGFVCPRHGHKKGVDRKTATAHAQSRSVELTPLMTTRGSVPEDAPDGLHECICWFFYWFLLPSNKSGCDSKPNRSFQLYATSSLRTQPSRSIDGKMDISALHYWMIVPRLWFYYLLLERYMLWDALNYLCMSGYSYSFSRCIQDRGIEQK